MMVASGFLDSCTERSPSVCVCDETRSTSNTQSSVKNNDTHNQCWKHSGNHNRWGMGWKQGNNSGSPMLDSMSPTNHFLPSHLRTPGGDWMFCKSHKRLIMKTATISRIQHTTLNQVCNIQWEIQMEMGRQRWNNTVVYQVIKEQESVCLCQRMTSTHNIGVTHTLMVGQAQQQADSTIHAQGNKITPRHSPCHTWDTDTQTHIHTITPSTPHSITHGEGDCNTCIACLRMVCPCSDTLFQPIPTAVSDELICSFPPPHTPCTCHRWNRIQHPSEHTQW